ADVGVRGRDPEVSCGERSCGRPRRRYARTVSGDGHHRLSTRTRSIRSSRELEGGPRGILSLGHMAATHAPDGCASTKEDTGTMSEESTQVALTGREREILRWMGLG